MQWRYIPRWIAPRLSKAISVSSVAVLTGARQTGKTTLLRQEAAFRDWRFMTLDDLDVLGMAEKRPDELLAVSDRLVIDEVQKSPGLMLAVKRAVDEGKRKRRFVLSGSANLLLMKRVTESLAGRALYYELYPFCLGEERGRAFPDWLFRSPFRVDGVPSGGTNAAPLTRFELFRGWLPPVFFLRDDEEAAEWWHGYIRTYLERDLREISQVSSLADFRAVMTLLAARNAGILNQSEVARDSALSQATIGRYIGLLEVSGLLLKLRPYSRNLSKRVVKSPKIYFIDPGLVCALCGYRQAQSVPETMMGMLFETAAFLNLLAAASLAGAGLFYLRTLGGKEKEIDFLLEKEGKIVAVEVKYASKVGFRDAENLMAAREILPGLQAGIILYNGSEVTCLGQNIFAMPLSSL